MNCCFDLKNYLNALSHSKVILENALKADSPFQSVFLDRLATVYRQLNDQAAYQRTLRQFQQLNDPISIQQSLSVPPLFQLLSPEPMESLINTSFVQRNWGAISALFDTTRHESGLALEYLEKKFWSTTDLLLLKRFGKLFKPLKLEALEN